MRKPKLRFQGYTDDWEQRKVGDITKELSEYAKLNSGLPLLTSARTGLMYQSDYRGNSTTDNENTLFSIVPLNACTYRHMSDDSTFHINVNTLEKGLVSKEYPVFVENESDLRFVVQYINSSDSFTKFCTEQKKGGTRTRLYYKTLCEYKMLIPSLNEQYIIADYFDNLDYLITLHQRKCEETKKLKKYMLQKMFPKKGMTVPEIRFDGFTDDWEQRKLGELGSLKNGMNFSKDAMGHGFPFVNLQNIFGSNVVNVNELGLADATEKQLLEYSLLEGDVLFVRSSVKLEGVGEAALVPENLENTTYSGFIIRFRDEYGLNNDFKKYIFGTPKVRNQIMAQATNSANKNISQGVLENLTFEVPSFDEQAKIGEYFNNLDHLITLHQ